MAVDAEELVTVKSAKICAEEVDKVTPGSEIFLRLEVESHFPLDLDLDNVLISLSFSDPVSYPIAAEEVGVGEKRSKRIVRTAKQKITR